MDVSARLECRMTAWVMRRGTPALARWLLSVVRNACRSKVRPSAERFAMPACDRSRSRIRRKPLGTRKALACGSGCGGSRRRGPVGGGLSHSSGPFRLAPTPRWAWGPSSLRSQTRIDRSSPTLGPVKNGVRHERARSNSQLFQIRPLSRPKGGGGLSLPRASSDEAGLFERAHSRRFKQGLQFLLSEGSAPPFEQCGSTNSKLCSRSEPP